MAPQKNLFKEINRYALCSQQECLKELKCKNAADLVEEIENKIQEIEKALNVLDRKPGAPRKQTAYNNFIRFWMPKLAEENPELTNQARMKLLAGRWKTLAPDAKKEFNE